MDDNKTQEWHPVYCRLRLIHGLESEMDRCKQVLDNLKIRTSTVILVRVKADWLFGLCNFKAEPNDEYDLKFFDRIDTIIRRDLEIFAEGGVDQLFFPEKDLFDEFESRRDKEFERFRIEARLVQEK